MKSIWRTFLIAGCAVLATTLVGPTAGAQDLLGVPLPVPPIIAPAPAPAPLPAPAPAPAAAPAPLVAPAAPAPAVPNPTSAVPSTTVPGVTAPGVPVPAAPDPVPVPGAPAPAPGPKPLPPGRSTEPNVRPGPGDGWTLTGSRLRMLGSRFGGVVDSTRGGQPVKCMRFTVDRLEITDLVQRGNLGNGKIVRVASAPGAVSTVTGGGISVCTLELSGILEIVGYPTVPITLTPEMMANTNLDLSFLQLPTMVLRDAFVNNVTMNGSTTYVPGATVSLE